MVSWDACCNSFPNSVLWGIYLQFSPFCVSCNAKTNGVDYNEKNGNIFFCLQSVLVNCYYKSLLAVYSLTFLQLTSHLWCNYDKWVNYPRINNRQNSEFVVSQLVLNEKSATTYHGLCSVTSFGLYFERWGGIRCIDDNCFSLSKYDTRSSCEYYTVYPNSELCSALISLEFSLDIIQHKWLW